MEFWAFFDISDKPIKIQTLSTPQNDRLDLLFMKDVYVGAKKWPEMVLKKSFMSSEFCATVSMYLTIWVFGPYIQKSLADIRMLYVIQRI